MTSPYSLIITTKNEAKTIVPLLHSIMRQTIQPSEILIADAASTDGMLELLHPYEHILPLRIIPLVADANRSVGRNRAIAAASFELLLLTDAGCLLDETWAEEVLSSFHTSHASVIAGFYRGKATSVFEQCQIPYVLVMPDRLNPATFLPSTRSMGMKKKVWEMMGGFDETLRYGEDYAFARQLQVQGVPIAVAQRAIVSWRPRPTVHSFARMIFEHAQGDAYSQSWRGKVGFIFGRYVLFMIMACIPILRIPLFFLLVLYIGYAIIKNDRYIHHWKAFLYLPLFQLVSDGMVMWGTLLGIAHSADKAHRFFQ